MNNAAPPVVQVSTALEEQDEQNELLELVQLLLAGRFTIFFSIAAAMLLAGLYCLLATPSYQVDALVQVEPKEHGVAGDLGPLGELLGQAQPVAGEIQIIGSRLVLEKVVSKEHLDISAAPIRFPLIGSAAARQYHGDGPAKPWLGLVHFAWGGEKVVVDRFDIPRYKLNKPFRLRVQADGMYDLYDEDDTHLLQGRVGEEASADTNIGHVSILVSELRSRPGTKIVVAKAPMIEAIRGLRSGMQVMEEGKESNVIGIKLRGQSPGALTRVLNDIVDEYVQQNVSLRSTEAAQQLAFLEQQLPKVKTQLEQSEDALNGYRLRRGSADIDKQTELLLQQSVDVENQRLALKQRQTDLSRLYRSDHPMQQTLTSQMQQLDGRAQQLEKQISQLPQTEQELLRLKRDVDVNTELYTSLLDQSQALQIAKAGTVGNVRVVDHAMIPFKQQSPNVPLVMVVAVAMGLMLGMAALFIRRAMMHGVTDPFLIESALNLPSFAMIPYSKAQNRIWRRRQATAEFPQKLLAVSAPNDPAVEALRSLRTALQFALLDDSNNVITFSGAGPGLGKSFIALNLGALLASSGKSVVVVDADMRRGRIHEHLGFTRSPGLSDAIAGRVGLDEAIKPTVLEKLSCICAGTLPPNPAELLQTQQFKTLVNTLSARYDYVVLDSPPILAVTDGALISRLAGCTMMVVKEGEHSLRVIAEAVRRLQRTGAQVRGIVFNQVGVAGKYGYGYGAGYYNDRYYTYSSHEE